MTAEEMFKELGYDKDEFLSGKNSPCYVKLRSGVFLHYDKKKIFFNDKHQSVYCNCYFNGKYDVCPLCVDEIEAINKQIEELGWDK